MEKIPEYMQDVCKFELTELFERGMTNELNWKDINGNQNKTITLKGNE